ncbi:MAG: TIGR01459 family HAD-type hydrolase [Hyphomicrobiales bacterium]
MSLKISRLEDITPHFDAFLIDQFGVLLNGKGAYPFAPSALQQLAELDKRIVLLSNSGKRAERNNQRLVHHGFNRSNFETVLSSGEVAFSYLKDRIGLDINPGARVLLLARDGDVSAIDGLSLGLTENSDDADLILLAGSRGDEMDLAAYRAKLNGAASRGVPCICTNPDMTMMTSVGKRFGAGKIAELYEELGGSVHWIGKPHKMIYESALKLLGETDRQRVLCIGDSPAHDIAGGHAAGLQTALVRTGIHAEDTDADIEAECRKLGVMPNFFLNRFSFSH